MFYDVCANVPMMRVCVVCSNVPVVVVRVDVCVVYAASIQNSRCICDLNTLTRTSTSEVGNHKPPDPGMSCGSPTKSVDIGFMEERQLRRMNTLGWCGYGNLTEVIVEDP